MFCPKCRAEYREGFTECSDCHVKLVADLNLEENEPEYEFRDLFEVYSTWRLGEASFIKSLLESNGIDCFIHNEHYPSMNFLISTAIPIKIMVPKEKTEEAKDVIDEYQKS